MNRFAGFMGLFERACAASTSGAQDSNQETVRTTVLYMNNSTYVCSIRRTDSVLEAGGASTLTYLCELPKDRSAHRWSG